MNVELISMAGGALLGIVGKFINLQSQRRSEEIKALSKQSEIQNETHNQANQRGADGGKWVRRILVVAILLGVVLFPFVLPFFEVDTIVMIEEKRGWLGRLFNSDYRTSFETVKGYLLIPELRQCLSALIGFYFGQSIMRK